MKKTKLLGLAAVAVAVIASVAFASGPGNTLTRSNQHNQEANPWYGGYSSMRNSSTGEMIVCSGRCLLAAVLQSTGPQTSTVKVRNSSVANGTGALVYWNRFEVINTEPGNNYVRLPILLDKGITVQLPSASSGEEVTVLFLQEDAP